ncbi:ExbD/TolR family protein [Xanthomonadaceae bacterium JHOS43]|nr:ExbD/TolR family protein [Xanthomonadaceae bacterium JHOS43]MCX7562814.1 ExbD/TolR family protein [Xanthomonadaceae bacterium XH05]
MSMRIRKRRKLKAEINVVPYIDVMLVLLIIFMVTAPLLQLGVDVKLPQADARGIQAPKDPVVVGVTREGRYLLKLEGQNVEEMDEASLEARIAAFVRQSPETAVFIDGDMDASYSMIYRAMATLQRAGATRITFRGDPAR